MKIPPKARAFGYHVAVTRLEDAMRHGVDAGSAISALCQVMAISVIGEAAVFNFRDETERHLFMLSRYRILIFSLREWGVCLTA